MLKPLGINVDYFIAKTKPVRRFRLAYWGKDLIDAMDSAPPLGETDMRLKIKPANRGNRRGRSKKENGEKEKLIGGHFKPKEVGL